MQPSGLRPGFKLQKILQELINVLEDQAAHIRYYHDPPTIPHAKISTFSQEPFEVIRVVSELLPDFPKNSTFISPHGE